MSAFKKKSLMKTEQYEEARRYKDEWASQFSWVRESPDNEGNAYCVFCKLEMKPHKSCLVAHEKTKAHVKVMESIGDQISCLNSVDDESLPPPLFSMSLTKYWSVKDDDIINSELGEDSAGQDAGPGVGEMGEGGGAGGGDAVVNAAELARLGISLTSVPQIIEMTELWDPNQQIEKTEESLDQGPVIHSTYTVQSETVATSETSSSAAMDLDTNHQVQDGGQVIMVDKSQPSKLYEEVVTQLKTASRFDTLWFCKDGCYKVHKVIVASASPFLRQILEQEQDDQISVIFTPDFSCSVIKPIICLFYTGNVNVAREMISEVKAALQLFEFNGDKVTVSLRAALTKHEIVQQEFIMNAMERNGKFSVVAGPTKRKRKSRFRDESEGYSFGGYGNGQYGSGSDDDDWGGQKRRKSYKQLLNTAPLLKCEVVSDEEYSDYKMGTLPAEKKAKGRGKKKGGKLLGFGDYFSEEEEEEEEEEVVQYTAPRGRGRPKKIKTTNGDDSWGREERKPGRKKTGPKPKSVKNEGGDWPEDKENGAVKKRSWKFLEKADTCEMYRTRGRGKDERSLQLSEALFDGQQLDFIFTCIACYSVFDFDTKLEVHKDEVHPEGVGPGDLHTDQPNEYQCPKCGDIIAVKHLAWFCKHVKFCGENNEIANDLITPGEDSSDCDDEAYFVQNKQPVYSKNTPERLQIMGGKKGRNMQILSKVLAKKLVKFIWGCSLCYTVYLSEEDLESHRREKHPGEDMSSRGGYWNPTSQNYTCPHCKKIQSCRHLVWFIYHMHKCKMALSGSSSVSKIDINAEEDSDEEDNNEDVMDPEGILFRTYKVKGTRAEWICEGLFGRILEQLYPCHVCYTVHPSAQELQEHFLTSHPNLLNRLENGAYYRKAEQCFSCPICLKNVCNKKTNSIFFTYHFRKCNNQTFPVQKKCPNCTKELNSYSSYRDHLESSCEAKNVMCHFCTKCFISNATLNHHIKYVHRTDRPFQCHLCEKSYKANCELKVHIKTSHSLHYNYSCEKCGKQFYGKKTLSVHMATHLPEAERKYGCNMCGRRFSKKKFLNNHLTTHSEVRHFSCEICGARVKTRDTLKQHRKKVHKIFTPAPKQHIPPNLLLGPVYESVDVKEEVEEVIVETIDEDESACAAIIALTTEN